MNISLKAFIESCNISVYFSSNDVSSQEVTITALLEHNGSLERVLGPIETVLTNNSQVVTFEDTPKNGKTYKAKIILATPTFREQIVSTINLCN